jgi:hypothetical protein
VSRFDYVTVLVKEIFFSSLTFLSPVWTWCKTHALKKYSVGNCGSITTSKLSLRMSQERGRRWFELVLNIHTPFSSESDPNFFVSRQLGRQKKTILRQKQFWGLICPSLPLHTPSYDYAYRYWYYVSQMLEVGDVQGGRHDGESRRTVHGNVSQCHLWHLRYLLTLCSYNQIQVMLTSLLRALF